MFTGLVEDIGIVSNIFSYKIEITTFLKNILKGESIAVNGVCLTATTIKHNYFIVDYSPHTYKNTTISNLIIGSKVNLERALQLSSRIGGHIVSGHVDGVAQISSIEKTSDFYRVSFICKNNILNYIIEKGSVAIDGISLTISQVSDISFEVFIIPETFRNTTICLKKIGDNVNIEVDIFSKYVEKFISKKAKTITDEMLKENGFI